MKKIFLYLLFSMVSGAVYSQSHPEHHAMASQDRQAVCELLPTQGNNVSGTILFTEVANGVRVSAELRGLSKGNHGFHIHERGDCSAPDASSAGGHFNPKSMKHGGPEDNERHSGDLGNLNADASGYATLEYIDEMLSFNGDVSILEKSVIVHEGADDFKTQPTGNSGGRVACGIIRLR